MALSTEHHCFPMSLDHLAFPRHLPFEISQFPHVVYFYLPLSGSTPFALVGAPSLTFMAEATSEASLGSFGTAYGLYNAIWAVGLLTGPTLGGYLFERMRFSSLALGWGAIVALATLALPVFRSASTARR